MLPPDATSTDANNRENDDFSGWVQPALKNCWYLTGPTASGKTPLAIAVAQQLDAEIISLDSMAIYRGMDIGTAKPTPEQRAIVPHHQLDIVDPTDAYSVSSFVRDAHAIAAQIRARGRNVLVCGGTPLYLKSLIRGSFQGPAADWEFRQSVEDDVQRVGGEALRERLMQVDPLLAHKLHPNDHRRMIRALEVARVTGRPLSHWQQQFDTPASQRDCPVAVLRLERAWLHQRINTRVSNMIKAGLETEVRGLLQRYGALGQTAKQAVGYREMLDYVASHPDQAQDAAAAEATALAETVELIRAHTRQFARRQEIWFRGLRELQGIPVTPQSSQEDLVAHIVAIFQQAPQKDPSN
ncbi:MAG: tRNA (adenosine(37)-N6)-dimethylallyltransferase MiaA [Pirellulaceae bacterium]